LKVAGVVNATQIAVEEIGRDIPNTCLLGAFAAATQWLKVESILACLKDYLSGDILQRNVRSCERGFREVKILKWQ
jgi:Pyruvate/2-oxoacid:ferredoxin oxidoreductase gamma subunit